jgi:hypothetical protein
VLSKSHARRKISNSLGERLQLPLIHLSECDNGIAALKQKRNVCIVKHLFTELGQHNFPCGLHLILSRALFKMRNKTTLEVGLFSRSPLYTYMASTKGRDKNDEKTLSGGSSIVHWKMSNRVRNDPHIHTTILGRAACGRWRKRFGEVRRSTG